jgi:hypothetical protein
LHWQQQLTFEKNADRRKAKQISESAKSQKYTKTSDGSECLRKEWVST